MTARPRIYRIGDVVTLKASVLEVYDEMSVLVLDIDGKRIEIRSGWDGIADVKAFDPHAIYRELK